MSDVQANRLANGRAAIAKAGGVAAVARKMGYRNASYLVQIFGPNPTRQPTEKRCRQIEDALGLTTGSLDMDVAPALPPPTTKPLDQSDLARVIALVGKIAHEESVTLDPERFARLTTMAYEDGVGAVTEGRLRQVMQLLR
jgi:hypothetical protein